MLLNKLLILSNPHRVRQSIAGLLNHRYAQDPSPRPVLLSILCLSAFTTLMGMTVIFGWYTGNSSLIQVFPTLIPMQLSTAICFMLCGLGFIAFVLGNQTLANSTMIPVLIIASASLLTHLFNFEFAFDQLWLLHFLVNSKELTAPMAPNTALCFLLICGGLSLSHTVLFGKKSILFAIITSFIATLLSAVALIGYITGVQSTYSWGGLTGMAVHTSIGILMLSYSLITHSWFELKSLSVRSEIIQPIDRKNIVVLLTAIMVAISVTVGLTIIRELYSSTLNQHKTNLTLLVNSFATMLDSSPSNAKATDSNYNTPHISLEKMKAAHKKFTDIWKSGEFVIARRIGNDIQFILHQRLDDYKYPTTISLDSLSAEPMRRALRGDTGTVKGLDYRNVEVMAAYVPLPEIQGGLVAKIDIADINRPFIRSAVAASGAALFVILIGYVFIQVLINPIIKRLNASLTHLNKSNYEKKCEITERIKVEKALLKTSNQLVSLMSNIPGVVFRSKIEWPRTFDQISEGIQLVSGYSSDFFSPEKANSLGNLIFDQDKAEVMEQIEQSKNQASPYNIEYRITHKDGSIRWIQERGQVIFDENRTPKWIDGVLFDATERKQIAEDRDLLATVAEQADELIIITDHQAKIIYVNPAFEKATGYSSDEVLGKEPSLLKSEKHDHNHYNDLWKTISSGKVWRGPLINKKKDGSLFEENATISPLLDDNGQVAYYVAVKRDVTQTRELEQQVRQSQKMEALGNLASGISHDFNNILSAILGYTSLSLERLSADSHLYRNLMQVQKAGKRASDLVHQILIFSAQKEQEVRPTKIKPIVKELLTFLRATIPSTIELEFRSEAENDIVMADPTQMHQVLMNLCTNSAFAMKSSGGTLRIELKQVAVRDLETQSRFVSNSDSALQITIEDTGEGISPAHLNHIFEPYFTTKEKGEGTGLGLAVVHGIITSMGGTIQVESFLGRGTTFTLLLPQAAGHNPDDITKKNSLILRGNERILFIDDEAPLVEIAKLQLSSLGYHVTSFTDPLRALDAFQSCPDDFDIVVTDKTMPGLTGIELAQEIKTLREQVPIILCTGYREKGDSLLAREAGIATLVNKPFDKNEIASVLRAVLDANKTLKSESQELAQ